MEPFKMTKERQDYEQQALLFKPEDWGMKRSHKDTEFMFLNMGPNHPSAHGAFRIALQLDGEVLVDCVPDIGYHHRGAEKMAERQSRRAPRLKCVPGNRPKLTKAQRKIVRESRRANR